MTENAAVWHRYIQLLIYKLTKYTSPQFVSDMSKKNTRDKIAIITNLKDDLDNAYISYIFKKDYVAKKNATVEEVMALSILREIYSFLYEDNNVFSQKSYLRLLVELGGLEKYNGNNAAFQKVEIEKLEQAVIQKMQLEIKNKVDTVTNPEIKSKINALLNTMHRMVYISQFVIILMMSSLMLGDATYKSITEQFPPVTVTVQNTALDKVLEFLKIDRKYPKKDDLLTHSAQFLQLADTCAAWSIIKSLEHIKIRSDVTVEYDYNPTQEKTDTVLDQSTSRRERFARLCSQAVNYTINEYPKYNKDIKSWPKSIHINFIHSETDRLGCFNTKTKNIDINESNLTLDNGANAFALFSVIAHETVHRLIDYNIKSFKMEYEYYTKLDTLVHRGIKPDTLEVEKLMKLALENNKYTEIEAHKFEYKIFNEFFKGILIDAKKVITGAIFGVNNSMDLTNLDKHLTDTTIYYNYEITDSYLRALGISEWMIQSMEAEQMVDSIGKIKAAIIENVEYISMIIPAIESMMAEIDAGRYNDALKTVDGARNYYMTAWQDFKK